MNYNESGSGYSLSDIAAVTGRNNNNDGFGEGSGWWIILLLLALGGWNNGFGGYGGGYNGGGVSNDYAWLSNGQKEIMQNTNDGFNTLQLANQLTGIDSSIDSLSAQVCSGFANTNQTINSGFANAETSANARQMANMQQAFNSEITTLNGFNNINNALQQCCCDNRLATCQTQNIIQNEGNATRFADANNTRDIITNATSNTQAILDKLCQLELDGVKRENDQLRSQLQFANMQASQVQQTADLRASQATTANRLVSELRSCPIPAQPVYGNTPIFTCNGNNGCGCGNNVNF